jgi:hypothetical protein
MARSYDIRLIATVALAALVVAGGVSAAEPTTDYDARLDSAQTAWQGQTLYFDGSAVVDESLDAGLREVAATDRNFTVRTVRDDGTLGRTVQTVTLDETGVATVETAELHGTYVLVYDGNAVAVDDGLGTLRNAAAGANLSACAWGVTDDSTDVVARFDGTTEAETIQLPNQRDARLSGQVNLPTGTELTVRLHNDGSRPVLFSLQTELGPENRFDERLDLTAVQQGTPLNVSVSHEGQTLVTTTAVVGDAVDVPSETTSTRQTERRSATTSSPAWASLPGVEISAGVVALTLAAIVLAVRRATR